MTDTPAPTKARKSVRKGAPPTPAETLGALGTPAESAAPAPAPAVAAEQPKASKPARAKAAVSKAAASKPSSPKLSPPKAAVPAAPKRPRKPVSERTKPLNFRVTNEFRKAFKQAAATEDCKKVELLERMFEAWSAAHSTPSH